MVEDLLRRYASAWEDNDRAGWLATFAADATQEDPVGSEVRNGHQAIGAFWDRAMGSYESIAITPTAVYVAAGDRDAAMVWRITAETPEGWQVFGGVDVFEVDDAPLITGVRAFWQQERRFVARSEAIHHLAAAGDWDPHAGAYLMSTVGRTLAQEGFIHCSYADQVTDTARRFYASRDDVILLTIDPALVPSEVKVEGGFPHIYGPLPTTAVIRTRPYPTP